MAFEVGDETWDEPTFDNLTKYFKSQNFTTKADKIGAASLTLSFLQGVMARGEYWCLGKLLFIIKKFLPQELAAIYFNSIKYRLNLDKNLLILEKVKFPARELAQEYIRLPERGPAFDRGGYGLKLMTDFYRILKDQQMLIRTLKDFQLMVLPIFYLIHGEAYDSDDPKTMTSYYMNVSKSQINIQCLRCKSCKWTTLNLEFLYHNSDTTKDPAEPIDITVNTRGSPFHGLHYYATHGYFGYMPVEGGEEGTQVWKRVSVDET